MPELATLMTFIVALFFLEITPGPDMMLVMGRGIGQGRRVALFTVLGMVFLAGIVQVALLVLGIASLLQAYPFALTILRYLGAIYLLWLGFQMIRASMQPAHLRVVASAGISDHQALKQGAINSLTNPKSLLFMFAFLPQFVDPAVGPVWLQLLILGSIQKLAGILSLGSVAMASGTLGRWLTRWPALQQWQERFTGMVMFGLGIRLMLSDNSAPSPRPQ